MEKLSDEQIKFTDIELEQMKLIITQKLSHFQRKRDINYNCIICNYDPLGNCKVNFEKASKKCELYEGIFKKLVNYKNNKEEV